MTMIVCKLTNKNTTTGHTRQHTHTHTHRAIGVQKYDRDTQNAKQCEAKCVRVFVRVCVSVCVGVAATGRMPNDLDKNNCAVIIIKTVFGQKDTKLSQPERVRVSF